MLENKNVGSTDVNLALQYRHNNTLGASAEGQRIVLSLPDIAAVYRIEYAAQTFENSARNSYVAKYKLFEAGIRYTDLAAKAVLLPRIGYQVMGSDVGSYGFQTPYATKNSFNGWDEKFLVTPNEGLRSRYVSVQTDLRNNGITLIFSGYKFSSDKNSVDFGGERDIQLLKRFGENYTLGMRYADYRGRSNVGKFATASGVSTLNATNADTKKLLIWIEYNI